MQRIVTTAKSCFLAVLFASLSVFMLSLPTAGSISAASNHTMITDTFTTSASGIAAGLLSTDLSVGSDNTKPQPKPKPKVGLPEGGSGLSYLGLAALVTFGAMFFSSRKASRSKADLPG
jgi:hypothetical protein